MSGRRRARGSNLAVVSTLVVAAVATYHLGLGVGFLIGFVGLALTVGLAVFEEQEERRGERRARMRAAAWREVNGDDWR